MRVVIWGGSEGEAWLRWRAWQAVEGASVTGTGGGAEDRAARWGVDEVPDPGEADAQVLDLLDPPRARLDLATAALEAGHHLLLGPPFASTAEQVDRLVTAAQTSGAVLGDGSPWPFHPPLVHILEQVRAQAVGRITAVRMRSLLGGRGGWDVDLSPDFGATSPPDLDPTGVLAREVFDKTAIAAALLGPIRELHCHAPGQVAPCASLVAWHHEAHGCLGVLEIGLAPALVLRSAYEPRDDTVEITGSAGLVWLTRGQAQLRNEPSVRMFRGEDLHAWGNLDDDWQSAHTACVRAFARVVRAGGRPPLARTRAAVVCVEAAHESASTGERVTLPR